MEFSDIQPVSPSGQFQPTSISSAADLSFIFNSRANAGDQIEIFLAIAEGQTETAITSFSTVVRNLTSPPIKALALQGFGKISQPYKQALASCASKESQELLKLLCGEIRNRSNDLTTWAAAEALKEIGFSLDNIQHPQGGNLSEPPRRIQNEILDQKIQEINRIQRFNSREQFTAEYERFLEFWIYGPTIQFFEESFTSQRYIEIADDILHATQVRGIQLGLNSNNKKIQELSIAKLENIFKEFSRSKSGDLKYALGESLKRFLRSDKSSDSDLQILVDAFNFEISKDDLEKLDLTQLSIEQINQSIEQSRYLCSEISSKFSLSVQVSGERSINNFLFGKKDKYGSMINSHINKLNEQRKNILNLEKILKSNINLLETIVESIKKYDDELIGGCDYGLLSYAAEARLPEIKKISVSASLQKSQNELQEIDNRLSKIRKEVCSDLSRETDSLWREVTDLRREASEGDKNGAKMMIHAAVSMGIAIFVEVIIAVLIVILLLVGFAAVGGG